MGSRKMLVPKGSPSEIRIRPQLPPLADGGYFVFREKIFQEVGIRFVLNWCMALFCQDVKKLKKEMRADLVQEAVLLCRSCGIKSKLWLSRLHNASRQQPDQLSKQQIRIFPAQRARNSGKVLEAIEAK